MKKPNKKLNIDSRGDKIFLAIVNILMIFVVLVTFYPFWDIFILSLMPAEEAVKGGWHLWTPTIDFTSYRAVLSSPEIKTSAFNSLWRVFSGTLITVIMTTLTAYPLSKREQFPGYKLWMTLALITMYFGGGLIPTYLTYKNLGLINSRWVLVLPGAVSGYNLIITRNFLRSIPVSLEESARLDGASEFIIWLRIILPLSLPIMATIATWSAVGHWNAYFDALIYITDRSKYVLQIVLRRVLLEGQSDMFMKVEQRILTESSKVRPPEEQIKAAFIMVCTLPILIVYPFAQKYFMKGIMVGAVKG